MHFTINLINNCFWNFRTNFHLNSFLPLYRTLQPSFPSWHLSIGHILFTRSVCLNSRCIHCFTMHYFTFDTQRYFLSTTSFQRLRKPCFLAVLPRQLVLIQSDKQPCCQQFAEKDTQQACNHTAHRIYASLQYMLLFQQLERFQRKGRECGKPTTQACFQKQLLPCR